MPFEQGQQKTGGRRSGTPNRRTNVLSDILDELNIDLPTRIFEILPTLTPEKQIDVLLQLMPFMYPKRKAVEITPVDELSHFDRAIIARGRSLSKESLRDEIDRLIKNRDIIQKEEDEIAAAAAKVHGNRL
jgi:hypothetical protein